MPVIVVAGDEEFEVSRRVSDLTARLLDKDWAAFNFSRLDNPPLIDVIDAAASLPFGMGNRVVVIDRCDLFTKKRTREGGKAQESASASAKEKQIEQLGQALSAVAASTYLIFSCPHNFDSSLKLSKMAEKHATIESFPKEKFWVGSGNPRLETWCRKEAHRYGATMDDAAIQYLLDSFEADLRTISSEIRKAATYVLPGKNITLDHVIELSPHHSHVFVLAEEWITGNISGALKSLREIVSRQSAMPVIAALQTMLGKWIQMKAIAESVNASVPGGPGVSRRELPYPELAKRVAQQLNQKSSFVVEKDLKRIRAQSVQSLIDKRRSLTHYEHLVKTGQMPEQHALEAFLLSG